ncbi:MAG: penicillin-binding protein 2 [Actinomycetia bacterium]|nr:penicillin-binding protein 2 [Actinomycetes bacterium]MCP4959609.1 penicillin-binding protein 2 [Actinomycetes bacterium]
MNLRIRTVTAVLLGLYTLLFIQLNLVQLVRADDYRSHPDNTRDIVRQFSEPRGAIVTADGVVVAETVEVEGELERLREYPHGELYAHLTGYVSLNYGASGLESAFHAQLAGTDREIDLKSLSDLFVDRVRTADVVLTIDHSVQRIARAALGERNGAVVAIDTQTGAILAMYAWPTFDPNLLSSHDLDQAREDRFALVSDPEKPTRSRAFQERYPPGSTFKIVTAAAGLEEEVVTPAEPEYEVADEYLAPQTDHPITNFGDSSCGGNLTEMLRVSCNTGFAELGVQIGADALVAMAESFGFNSTPDIELAGVVESVVPSADFYDENIPLLAQSAIGQFDVAATPLQMALVAATVANDGVMLKPHLVAEVRDSEGTLVSSTDADAAATPIEFETARELSAMLENVAANGTARSLQFDDDIAVAGKTGTAEVGESDNTHAWIVGFAPADEPRVAVAVFLQGDVQTGPLTGGTHAGPVAREVMRAALEALIGDPTEQN